MFQVAVGSVRACAAAPCDALICIVSPLNQQFRRFLIAPDAPDRSFGLACSCWQWRRPVDQLRRIRRRWRQTILPPQRRLQRDLPRHYYSPPFESTLLEQSEPLIPRRGVAWLPWSAFVRRRLCRFFCCRTRLLARVEIEYENIVKSQL